MTALDTPAHRFQAHVYLHQFLLWAALAAVAASIAFFTGGFLLNALPLIILAIGAIALLALELFAMWLNRQAKQLAAIYTVSSAIAGYSILVTLVVPDLLPLSILGPMVVIAIVFPYLDRITLLGFGIGAVVLSVIIAALGVYVRLFEPLPFAVLNPLLILLVAISMPVIMLLFWHNYQRIVDALQQSEQSNRALQAIRERLEEEVAKRTSDLQQAVQTLEQRFIEQQNLRRALEQQREVIRGLSVPILPVTNDILVMPLIGEVDHERLTEVSRRALTAIAQTGARNLFIDITAVPVVDEEVANGLITVFQAVRLLGAQVSLVGVRPEVAQSLVMAAIDLKNIQTFASLQDALARTLGYRERVTDGERYV
ncbi:STAS domain-containing protein [uncultured Chloroflexus sp.]|uniref:STAS domain-containing protein n=1 Tax=uncultured Chloroflexus sp. TaxID=214040 RepID=UPI00260D0854|nr:STAS domain-containing protein [uncultured Chloroflexus sp.]